MDLRGPFQAACALALLAPTVQGQDASAIEGVYTSTQDGIHRTWILVDGYASQTRYSDTAFIATQGGPFTWDGSTLEVAMEFNSAEAGEVGQRKAYPWTPVADGAMEADGAQWQRKGHPQDLDGAWHITGIKREGELQAIHREGTRKTLKLLKDGWFQWFAIDPAKREFLGTDLRSNLANGMTASINENIYCSDIFIC